MTYCLVFVKEENETFNARVAYIFILNGIPLGLSNQKIPYNNIVTEVHGYYLILFKVI
jgi:hypothetical protein